MKISITIGIFNILFKGRKNERKGDLPCENWHNFLLKSKIV